jgi:hypothetical protein
MWRLLLLGAVLIALMVPTAEAPAAGRWSAPIGLGPSYGLWTGPFLDDRGTVRLVVHAAAVSALKILRLPAGSSRASACFVRMAPQIRLPPGFGFFANRGGTTVFALPSNRHPVYRWAGRSVCLGRQRPLPIDGVSGGIGSMLIGPLGTFVATGVEQGASGPQPVLASGRPDGKLVRHKLPHLGPLSFITGDALLQTWFTSVPVDPTHGRYDERWFEAFSQPRAGGFGRPVQVFHTVAGLGQRFFGPQVTLATARGDLMFGSMSPSGLGLISRRFGSRSTATRVLTGPGFDGSFLGGAMNASGDAVFTWFDMNGVARAAYIHADGRHSGAQLLGVAPVDAPISVVIDDAGAALAGWGHDGAIYVARADPQGRFARPTTVSPRGSRDNGFPEAAITSQGQAVVLWARTGPREPNTPMFLVRGQL